MDGVNITKRLQTLSMGHEPADRGKTPQKKRPKFIYTYVIR